MKCAWQAYLHILPHWMRKDVDAYGNKTLQELRLRKGLPPELVCSDGQVVLSQQIKEEDLQFVINCASQYSPWLSATLSDGYITAPGGHRIGVCGTAITENGIMRGIRDPSSLCIRVARDFPGIADQAELKDGSVLIIGPPGSGKTTFLRDLIRQRSQHLPGAISVVDERGELFPISRYEEAFFPGSRTDILRFCEKPHGIATVLKTMGPTCIAVDEITDDRDCIALQQAGWCGVSILGTAHAWDSNDLKNRPVYRVLIQSGIFQKIVMMKQDKSWKIERICL